MSGTRSSPGAVSVAVVAMAIVLAGTSSLVRAHHSFAMFDTQKTVTLTGTVTTFEWTNPHVYIELDVAEGETAGHWTIEAGSPSILLQSGWKFNDITPGATITATVNPLRDGKPGGLLGRVTLEDGRELPNGPGR